METKPINRAIKRALIDVKESEFATLTRSGQPISNPVFHYFSPDAASVDIATGVAYPAKANRARANPKVGMLLGPSVHAYDPMAMVEAGVPATRQLEDQPVVLVAAMGAVRDADLQANTDRYVRLFLDEHPKIGPPDWEVMKQMTNYWARIWVECAPVRIYFWPTGRLDTEQPVIWRAPADQIYPQSDPTPAGNGSQAKSWAAEPWRERAESVIGQFPNPILTDVDEEGFPVPFPALNAELVDSGFMLKMPRYAPTRASGKASLSFGVHATFLGEADHTSDGLRFTVNRLIGNLPSVFDNETDEAREMAQRLSLELEHRGQSMPLIRKVP